MRGLLGPVFRRRSSKVFSLAAFAFIKYFTGSYAESNLVSRTLSFFFDELHELMLFGAEEDAGKHWSAV